MPDDAGVMDLSATQRVAIGQDVVELGLAKLGAKLGDHVVDRRLKLPAVQHVEPLELTLPDGVKVQRGCHVLAVDKHDGDGAAVESAVANAVTQRVPDAEVLHVLLKGNQ